MRYSGDEGRGDAWRKGLADTLISGCSGGHVEEKL